MWRTRKKKRSLMQEENSFAAVMLERSASGYAGLAASLLLEKDPSVADRFPPDALTAWKSHLTQRIMELGAALAAGSPALFQDRVNWSRKSFAARDRDEGDIRTSLECLREVLADALPPPARPDVLGCLDQAVDALNEPLAPEASELDPARDHDRLALGYLQTILEGDPAAAINRILDAVENGLSFQDAYVSVLLPAQREIGRMWHSNLATSAEEHLVTSTTQRLMGLLAHRATPAEGNGRTVVAAAVEGNAHDVGLRATADLFQAAGWRTIFLGADVPAEDLPAAAQYFEADVVLISAMLDTHIARTKRSVSALRENCDREVKVIVGGHAFDGSQEVWQVTGADAYAGNAAGAVETADAFFKAA